MGFLKSRTLDCDDHGEFCYLRDEGVEGECDVAAHDLHTYPETEI